MRPVIVNRFPIPALRLLLMLQRASDTVFVASQSYQRGMFAMVLKWGLHHHHQVRCKKLEHQKQQWKELLFVLLLVSNYKRVPWITIVGLTDPTQMRWPRETYVSTRRSAFRVSAASFFVHPVNRCACCCPRSFRFCKGSEFGSSRPNVMVSVRWHTDADLAVWLKRG